MGRRRACLPERLATKEHITRVYTLRLADLHFASDGGIDIPAGAGQPPRCLDFAYVTVTIAMCHQVSDTTLRAPQIRRALAHALLSHVFGWRSSRAR